MLEVLDLLNFLDLLSLLDLLGYHSYNARKGSQDTRGTLFESRSILCSRGHRHWEQGQPACYMSSRHISATSELNFSGFLMEEDGRGSWHSRQVLLMLLE
jgi:hypothetical protein